MYTEKNSVKHNVSPTSQSFERNQQHINCHRATLLQDCDQKSRQSWLYHN